MQTFLPYADFDESAGSLDRPRLGKQRVENLQLLRAILDPSYGWQNHPAKLMWEGSHLGLVSYQQAIIFEWHDIRGYKDTCWQKSLDLLSHEDRVAFIDGDYELPSWLGDEDFHRSHQSNLIRKDPVHYGPQFPGVPDDLDYIWPVQ